jgi:hypothetical protein
MASRARWTKSVVGAARKRSFSWVGILLRIWGVRSTCVELACAASGSADGQSQWRQGLIRLQAAAGTVRHVRIGSEPVICL